MRVLQLTMSNGVSVMVNTVNISIVMDGGVSRTVYTIEESEPMAVSDTFESIMHAWRFGATHGKTGVFDCAKV